jgi:hypothetical protein
LLAGFLLGGIASASSACLSNRLSIGEEKVVCEVSFSYSVQTLHLMKSPAKP